MKIEKFIEALQKQQHEASQNFVNLIFALQAGNTNDVHGRLLESNLKRTSKLIEEFSQTLEAKATKKSEHPKNKKNDPLVFRLGDVVEPTSQKQGFTFGDLNYNDAVVICLAPFVLASRDGLASWRTEWTHKNSGFDINKLRVIGKAAYDVMVNTQHWLNDEEKKSLDSVTVLTLD